MLNGFIDDSGSEPSSHVFVLAGYILPAEVWAHFSDAWAAELLKPTPRPISYLHMKELGQDEMDDGQFAGWTIDEIEEKIFGLAAVLKEHQPLALTAHARWTEYEKFKNKSNRARFIQTPYKALFHEIIRIMYAFGEQQNNPQSVDFVFDEQGDVGTEAASWYLDIKAAFPPDARRFFGSTPIFRDDLLVVPLQAADMYAWFQRRRCWKPVVRPRFLEIEKMITKFFAVGSELDADGFEKAAIDFEKVSKWRESGVPIEHQKLDDTISDMLKVPSSLWCKSGYLRQ